MVPADGRRRLVPRRRRSSTWRRRPAQVGAWRDFVAACREVDAPENGVELTADEVRARCDSPTFLGGALRPKAATVHPARLSLGLRKEVLRRGVRLHEHTRVTKIARDGVADRARRAPCAPKGSSSR